MPEYEAKFKDARGALVLACLFAFVAVDIAIMGVIAMVDAVTTLNPYSVFATLVAAVMCIIILGSATQIYKDSKEYYKEAQQLRQQSAA